MGRERGTRKEMRRGKEIRKRDKRAKKEGKGERNRGNKCVRKGR